MVIDFYGQDLGARVVRKHLGWYLDRIGVPKSLRTPVLTAASPSDVESQLSQIFESDLVAA